MSRTPNPSDVLPDASEITQLSYEFQSTLHRTSADMHMAIAEEYLSAGGWNSAAEQREFIASYTDAELADEAIQNWGLTDPRFERNALIGAFENVREALLNPEPDPEP